jgi:hypothetical protein
LISIGKLIVFASGKLSRGSVQSRNNFQPAIESLGSELRLANFFAFSISLAGSAADDNFYIISEGNSPQLLKSFHYEMEANMVSQLHFILSFKILSSLSMGASAVHLTKAGV